MLRNPSFVFCMTYRIPEKIAACTKTDVNDVWLDIRTFFPTGGIVKRNPGDNNINNRVRNSISIEYRYLE